MFDATLDSCCRTLLEQYRAAIVGRLARRLATEPGLHTFVPGSVVLWLTAITLQFALDNRRGE